MIREDSGSSVLHTKETYVLNYKKNTVYFIFKSQRACSYDLIHLYLAMSDDILYSTYITEELF